MTAAALFALAALAAVAATHPNPPSAPAASAAGPARTEVRTPEGFLRVEEGTLEGGGGSLTLYPARAAQLPAVSSVAPAPPPPPSASFERAAPSGAACRAEREQYLRLLLRMAAIDVERPLELVEALSGGELRDDLLFSPLGLLAGVEPIRPLAWDPDLREAGRQLAACRRSAG